MFRTPQMHAIRVYQDEEEEPWDQRKSTPKRSLYEEEINHMEDGELPSLSSSKKSTPQGGDLEQRKFWGQLDVNSCDDDDEEDEEEEEDAVSRDKSIRRRADEEDMPDDELMSSASRNNLSKHRARHNAPRQSDELYQADSYEAQNKVLASGFCDTTLTALGDMCGAYTGTSKRVTLSPRIHSDVQEEHTAIEVEFVEEETEPARHHPDMSVESKNAYLSAMAAQAKEEFKSKTKKGGDKYDDATDEHTEGRSANTNLATTLDDADAYESFNAAEKRKFIRLINTGANPREATQLILQERSTLKPEPPRKATLPTPESSLPKRSMNDGKRSHRSHRSAVLYWKKSKYNQQQRSVSGDPIRPTISEDDQDDMSTPLPTLKDKTAALTDDDGGEPISGNFAKSGIHFYDAERQEDQEDEMAVKQSPSTPPSMKSTRSEQVRKVGFKSLAERRAKKSPKVTSAITNDGSQIIGESSKRETAARYPPQIGNDSVEDYDNILDTAEESGSFSKNASFDPELTLDDYNAAEPRYKEEKTSAIEANSNERNAALYANARKQYAGLSVPTPASDESVYTAQTSDTGYTGVTGMTAATTYTQSSRVRRPGAAKKRLAKEKELQEKAKGAQGWVESVKEVAAMTRQKWDPLLGLVDYLEPVVEEVPEKARYENIHLDLSKKISTPSKRSKVDDVGSINTAKSTPVPFPREWEEERERMIRETKNAKKQDSLATPSRDGIPSSNDDSRTNSWIESMKAASATLVSHGKQWDPDKGWVNDDGTSVAISTDGDFTTASSLPPPPPSAFTTDNVPRIKETNSPTIHDRIGASPIAQPERYVQLNDTGSVRSVHQDYPSYATSTKLSVTQPIPPVYESTYVSDDETDVDSAPLSNVVEAYPAQEKTVAQSAANVNVVKEKINNDDIGLFANGKNKNTGHAGRTESLGSEGLPELFASKDHDDAEDWNPNSDEDVTKPRSQEPTQRSNVDVDVDMDMDGTDELDDKQSKPSTRRGGGPVDLDELSAGSETKSTFSTNTDGRSIASFKLKSNIRDTSPLVRRRQAGKALVTPSPAQEAEDRTKVERDVFKDQNAQGKSTRRIQTGTSHESCDQEMVDHYHSAPRGITREDPSRDLSPKTRNTVAEWNSRGTETGSAPLSPRNSAEWKVFLAKKVRAERDASSRAAESLNMPRQLFKSSPDDGDGYDDDSIFDFKTAVNVPNDGGENRNRVHPTDKHNPPKAERGISQTNVTPIKSDSAPLKDISHLSPINSRDEGDAEYDDGRYVSTSRVHGIETAKRVNFFQRLAECTGPVLSENKGIPSSHLSFLQNNICGRPGDVHDDTASDDGILDKDIENLEKGVAMDDVANVSVNDGNEDTDLQHRADKKIDIKLARAKAGAGLSSRRSSTGSSVISEGSFGAKTAYLEAIAMKAAVATPRSRSRARSTSNSSAVSAASSVHSEKWKAFLERKKAGTSPSVISRASDERYKEMIARLKSSPRQVDADDVSQSAKDLSGAKVEALMAQLTGSNVSEAEI
ncbi:hypothetical protein FisN_3Lh597 [Fistulifera solaris]|uniref:Uncharacterized protein n=1 Tax=Fistulifera solaris TaxID=1519565 RepID=A0A1Z5J8U9_FISSO|nr:hypothetical protein FisN_3Lh597 [Fistulifera solaris]|eukprot:GAX10379.1 hypothetical protein FisN_3Lh597 [Fistulifera solaris]